MNFIERYMGIREATSQEVATWKKVDDILDKLSDQEFEEILDVCWNKAMSKKDSLQNLEMKIRKLNLHGITTKEVMTWYYVND